MAVTTLVSSVTKDDQTFHNISAKYSSGTFIFDIDESSFTDKMKRELCGVLVLAYDTTGTPLENRNVLWNMGKDDSIIVIKVPTSYKVQIQPVIDLRYPKTYCGETLDTVYPVTVKFDDAKTDEEGSGGGGGGDITVLTGDIIDNPTSSDVVTSQQVYEFVTRDEDLVYHDDP